MTVLAGTVLVGDGRHIYLLQHIRPGTRHVDVPPASHHGGHVLVVQGGVRQADRLDTYKHRCVREVFNKSGQVQSMEGGILPPDFLGNIDKLRKSEICF